MPRWSTCFSDIDNHYSNGKPLGFELVCIHELLAKGNDKDTTLGGSNCRLQPVLALEFTTRVTPRNGCSDNFYQKEAGLSQQVQSLLCVLLSLC